MTDLFAHDADFRQPEPFRLTRETIRQATEIPKPDNSAYLAAMREFRERYEQAERDMGGPVVVAELIFRRAE